MKNNLIERLDRRISENLIVKAIYTKDETFPALIQYIKKQSYLNVKKILKIIINNNYIVDKPIGYILIDDKKNIRGYLGTIFSCIEFKNKKLLQCYLHTWVVEKKYRLNSYRLLLKIQKDFSNIYIFTCNPILKLEGLYKKFGFLEKIYFKRILFPNLSNLFKKKNISNNK